MVGTVVLLVRQKCTYNGISVSQCSDGNPPQCSTSCGTQICIHANGKNSTGTVLSVRRRGKGKGARLSWESRSYAVFGAKAGCLSVGSFAVSLPECVSGW